MPKYPRGHMSVPGGRESKGARDDLMTSRPSATAGRMAGCCGPASRTCGDSGGLGMVSTPSPPLMKSEHYRFTTGIRKMPVHRAPRRTRSTGSKPHAAPRRLSTGTQSVTFGIGAQPCSESARPGERLGTSRSTATIAAGSLARPVGADGVDGDAVCSVGVPDTHPAAPVGGRVAALDNTDRHQDSNPPGPSCGGGTGPSAARRWDRWGRIA